MANPDDRMSETWAETLSRHLRSSAEYLSENEANISNVELDRIEKYSNLIQKILWDHNERQTVTNHNGSS